jgi:hypothetical protein
VVRLNHWLQHIASLSSHLVWLLRETSRALWVYSMYLGRTLRPRVNRMWCSLHVIDNITRSIEQQLVASGGWSALYSHWGVDSFGDNNLWLLTSFIIPQKRRMFIPRGMIGHFNCLYFFIFNIVWPCEVCRRWCNCDYFREVLVTCLRALYCTSHIKISYI